MSEELEDALSRLSAMAGFLCFPALSVGHLCLASLSHLLGARVLSDPGPVTGGQATHGSIALKCAGAVGKTNPICTTTTLMLFLHPTIALSSQDKK